MLAKVDLNNDLILNIKRSPLNAASSDAVFNLGDMKYMIWLCLTGIDAQRIIEEVKKRPSKEAIERNERMLEKVRKAMTY